MAFPPDAKEAFGISVEFPQHHYSRDTLSKLRQIGDDLGDAALEGVVCWF